jgi:hypothetical protein
MVSPLKVVQFSDYQKPQEEVSQHSKIGEKTASESDSEKTPEAAGNMGLPAIPDTPLCGNSEEEQCEDSGCEKKKKPSNPQACAKPVALASAGAEGHKSDCAIMTPGQLQAAYKSEYQSWKNSKSRCKKKGWPWASEWESFKGFLLSMGPKPTPAHTLHRTDNAVGAYGPDLCEWAGKVTQNNNKSDNIKVVVPLTGEVFTPQKLAKLHGVQVKTVYKWISKYYSVLELLAGKKSKPLHALSVKLDELPAPSPTPSTKKPLRPLKMPEFQYPYDEWMPIEDDEDHFKATGEMRATHYLAYRAEYDVVAAWADIVNAGLPIPAYPELKYYRMKPPSPEKLAELYKPEPFKPPPPKTKAPAPSYDDGYDPTDCLPGPDDEDDHYDECDGDGGDL